MHGWWAASYVVLWALVGALCILVVALARQIGTLHLRLGPRGALEIDTEGPPVGEAPEMRSASDLAGDLVTVGGPGQPRLLLFVSPTCPICQEVLPALGPAAAGGRLAPLVIADAGRREALEAFRTKRIDAPVVADADLAKQYDIPGTPFAVVLDDLGVVRAKGTVNDLEQMEGLVDTAIRRLEDGARERLAG